MEADLRTALASFIKASHSRSEDEWKAVPQNPDTNTVHSLWRDEIYYHWNHVFWDVSGFLGELSCTGVHMHPPSQGIFAVDYQSGATGVWKVWETDMLAIPAYLVPGISVCCSRRVDDIKDEGEYGEGEKMLGVFDGMNVYEVWYVKCNTSVMIHINATTEASGDIAVMVYGVLCRDAHCAEGDKEEKD